jgi:hypothetical protein
MPALGEFCPTAKYITVFFLLSALIRIRRGGGNFVDGG